MSVLTSVPVTAPGRAAGDAIGGASALRRFAALPVLVIAAALTLLELAVSSRYGFHRDELYFLACAHHLAWGYVDQPPFVPAVAWLSTHLLGTSPSSLRLAPALAAGAAVVLTGLTAQELGGGRKAQTLAALAAAISPQLLATFHLLSTAAFDDLFWCAATFVVARLLRTGRGPLWLVLGGITGVGLLNKWNIGFLVLALVVGLVVTGRGTVLLGRWPLAGACLAVVLWLPNLVWNAHHQWAEIAMTHSLHAENGGLGAVVGFIPLQVVVAGPVLLVFWVAGLRHLWRTPAWRPLAVAYLVLLGIFTLSGGKAYYLAGMYFVLFAAGGVWAERRLDARTPPRGVRGWVALMVAGAVLSFPLTLPVLPENTLPSGSWEGGINKDLSATVGWRDLVDQVAQVARTLPPGQRAHVVVLAGDYGAAGALDLWGPAEGLPRAISGHNTYWWWGPAGARDGATTIAVDIPRSFLRTFFTRVRPAGSVRTPHGVWTEERDDPISVCQGQTRSWAQVWPSLRHYG
jgi:hypothetical protein